MNLDLNSKSEDFLCNREHVDVLIVPKQHTEKCTSLIPLKNSTSFSGI